MKVLSKKELEGTIVDTMTDTIAIPNDGKEKNACDWVLKIPRFLRRVYSRRYWSLNARRADKLWRKFKSKKGV